MASGDGVGVERVHDQRLGQLVARRPRNCDSTQHARILVGLGGDEFLGHQVHAVRANGVTTPMRADAEQAGQRRARAPARVE